MQTITHTYAPSLRTLDPLRPLSKLQGVDVVDSQDLASEVGVAGRCQPSDDLFGATFRGPKHRVNMRILQNPWFLEVSFSWALARRWDFYVHAVSGLQKLGNLIPDHPRTALMRA